MKRNSFAYRHIGPKAVDVDQMLSTIGLDSIDTLIEQTIPKAIRAEKELDLSDSMTEAEFGEHIAALGEMNSIFKTYIGMGYHPTVLPGVIQRNILENPGWYTAYTPYQAEIAQGRLEALMNYQTMVVDLTGMELANASLLDEATAVAEAMSMFFGAMPRNKKKTGAHKFFVDQNTFPQSITLLKTRAQPIGVELVFGDYSSFEATDDFFGAMLQYPNSDGSVEDYRAFAAQCNQADIQLVVAADLMSLTLLTPPGEWGADAVVGTTQRFGIPLGYGGPHAAYFATKESYKRHIPGRIIGRTIDTDGNPALRMALQTREQHIKRDKATSNICTAQVLLAVMAGAYGVYHGPEGLMDIAESIHLRTATLNAAL
ncbi:MAG: glycine dehydrogenase, partial [Schleiferiaceae bacterium]